MKIVVTSNSKVKLNAVRAALGDCHGVEVIGVKAVSGVSEQPVGDETIRGARNRVVSASGMVPDADFYVSIENGLFNENGGWFDKAVILAVCKAGQEHCHISRSVEFPKDMVALAEGRGFATTTVGQVMQEMGLVKDSADPHLDLMGLSRADILKEAVAALFASLEKIPASVMRSRAVVSSCNGPR